MARSMENLKSLIREFGRSLAACPDSPPVERLRDEADWLLQELENGSLHLPLESTRDVYLSYALVDGSLDEFSRAKMLGERLLTVLIGSEREIV